MLDRDYCRTAVTNTEEADKVKLHRNICNRITDLYISKNHDYGDSFSKIFKRRGLLSTVIRLEDKVNRLDSLIDNNRRVYNESVKDTLYDIAGYAILTIMEIEQSK